MTPPLVVLSLQPSWAAHQALSASVGAGTQQHVVVRTPSGHLVADTNAALTLTEASIPPVLYIPQADLDDSVLERTETTSYCPYKGEANYFTIKDDETLTDTIWFYEHPHDGVSEITDHPRSTPTGRGQHRLTGIAKSDSLAAGCELSRTMS